MNETCYFFNQNFPQMEANIISVKKACSTYQVSKQWLYRIDKTSHIFKRIQGRTFVDVKKFEGLAK